MSLPHITPSDARLLIEKGAVLVDIRERDEHARERIPGAKSAPLSLIQEQGLTGHEGQVMIFHCKSGNRTKMNAGRFAPEANCDAFILDGGIDAWKAAGLPIEKDTRQPLEMNRQVQIATGGLALLGVVLGVLVDPRFYVLSGLVGAGLVTAGVTGSCVMAGLLKVMPWNRAVTA
jgi:rhodanese-related sulfurtransferase